MIWTKSLCRISWNPLWHTKLIIPRPVVYLSMDAFLCLCDPLCGFQYCDLHLAQYMWSPSVFSQQIINIGYPRLTVLIWTHDPAWEPMCATGERCLITAKPNFTLIYTQIYGHTIIDPFLTQSHSTQGSSNIFSMLQPTASISFTGSCSANCALTELHAALNSPGIAPTWMRSVHINGWNHRLAALYSKAFSCNFRKYGCMYYCLYNN